MERHDQMLPEKIYQVERQPVAWNKDRVWMQVQAHTVYGRRRYHYYYRVAAAVLFVIMCLVAWQPADLHVSAYTACVESVTGDYSTTRVAPAQTPLSLSDNVTPVESIRISPPDQDLGLVRIPTVNEQSLEDLLPVDDVIVASHTPANDSSMHATEVQRITPIVGVVLPAEPVVADARPRRKKILHTLEPVNKPAEASSSLLVARIK